MLQPDPSKRKLQQRQDNLTETDPTRTSATCSVRNRAGHSDDQGYRRGPNRVKPCDSASGETSVSRIVPGAADPHGDVERHRELHRVPHLGPDQLGFYNREMRYVVEPGTFQVTVGTNSIEGLEANFEVK